MTERRRKESRDAGKEDHLKGRRERWKRVRRDAFLHSRLQRGLRIVSSFPIYTKQARARKKDGEREPSLFLKN